MSSIERAAELLRSGSQAKQATPGEKAQPPKRDLIERASAELAQRRPTVGAGEPEGQSSSSPKMVGRPASSASRQINVDRDRLHAHSMIAPDGERSAIAESFRRIKRQILENIASPRPTAPPANLIMVTSAVAGEGKSFCAINLAISMALEVDRTVLLVDADVAMASIPRTFGLQAESGLMELLLDPQLDLANVIWKTDIGGLTLLPAGATHKQATELLASDAMRRLLRDMTARYPGGIVVFDAPPLLAASEAGALAGLVGQIVVVVESGKTSEAALKDALGRIDAGRVAGLILNKVEGPRLEYSYDAYG